MGAQSAKTLSTLVHSVFVSRGSLVLMLARRQ
jgi:hypothetical protein